MMQSEIKVMTQTVQEQRVKTAKKTKQTSAATSKKVKQTNTITPQIGKTKTKNTATTAIEDGVSTNSTQIPVRKQEYLLLLILTRQIKQLKIKAMISNLILQTKHINSRRQGRNLPRKNQLLNQLQN
jgi:hypothetical protein